MLPCLSCGRQRIIHVAVVLLDGTRVPQEIQDDQPGKELLESIYRHLNLIETAYFGLRFVDTVKQTHWLDPTKSIGKQLKGADTLYFGVKFYAADPCKLLEEITRYQVFLQVKQDVLQGRLPVAQDLAAELGALVVQSELGDYDSRRHPAGYVSEFRLVAHQTPQFETRVAQLHRSLLGLLPAEAELGYLEKVKWLDMYGVDLHPVLGEDNVDYFVGLTPSGLIVLRTKTKVANYYWPRITKLYFKGRYFMLRVKDKSNEESTYGFELPTRSACKHLWKCCVEHHAFFRLLQVSPSTSTSPSFFTLGSRFRYSGRTEKQAQRDAQLRARAPPPQFSRVPSRRFVEGRAPTPPLPAPSAALTSPPPPSSFLGTPACANSGTNNSLPTPAEPTTTPTSTRSAPWARGGLYGAAAASPRSVRSAGETHGMGRLTRRSSSVESQSSTDSRSCRHGRRRRHGSNRDGSRGPQVTATAVAGGAHSAVAVVRRASGYQHSGLESDSERSSARGHRTRHRTRHRHRHHQRATAEELARHLQFELVDPTGLSEDQLREIPYKVVHTTGTLVTPTVATAKRRRQRTAASSSPPPPYTPPPPPPPPPPLPVPSSTISQQQVQEASIISSRCDISASNTCITTNSNSINNMNMNNILTASPGSAVISNV